MKQLDASDRRQLLAVARRAIGTAVCRTVPVDQVETPLSPDLTAPAAAFVTIHEHGELRGCIGLMRFDVPLWLNVREAAVAAALDDPRFLPVDESELPALELEVSVLEPPMELRDPAGFVAGRHGIVVERGAHRALLLPQVAIEQGWDERAMLAAVCRKANLPADAWRDGATRLFIFESTCFGDDDRDDRGRRPQEPSAAQSV
ncbi:MAG: AmmeMemoRadiSam system protein A [Candidatus Limnocylindrales bacterium]